MSHIVTIATEIRDRTALDAACRRQSLPAPKLEATKLFEKEVTGVAVRLPDWRYPVVCDLSSGRLHYDNYSGRWGRQAHLDRLLQNYAVEKTHLEARRQGYSVVEQELPDGSIKLTVQVGGAV